MDQWKPAAVSGKTYGNFGRRAIGEGDWGHSDRGAFVFDVDDFATALIKFPEGQTVTLDVSWVMHQESASRMNVELYGTEAGTCVYPAKLLRFGANKGEYEVVSPQNVPIAMEHCCRQMNWVDAVLKRVVGDRPRGAAAVAAALEAAPPAGGGVREGESTTDRAGRWPVSVSPQRAGAAPFAAVRGGPRFRGRTPPGDFPACSPRFGAGGDYHT